VALGILWHLFIVFIIAFLIFGCTRSTTRQPATDATSRTELNFIGLTNLSAICRQDLR
jgi:hypothetical protein